jgi:hypothetical protein
MSAEVFPAGDEQRQGDRARAFAETHTRPADGYQMVVPSFAYRVDTGLYCFFGRFTAHRCADGDIACPSLQLAVLNAFHRIAHAHVDAEYVRAAAPRHDAYAGHALRHHARDCRRHFRAAVRHAFADHAVVGQKHDRALPRNVRAPSNCVNFGYKTFKFSQASDWFGYLVKLRQTLVIASSHIQPPLSAFYYCFELISFSVIDKIDVRIFFERTNNA